MSAVSYGILSSAPPTPCGIATFTTALGSALERQGADVRVVRVLDTPEEAASSPLRVVSSLVASQPWSIGRAASALNGCDIAVIQHEYGLYGGRDGSDVLRVLDALQVPSVAILHTVLPTPTTHQQEVLDGVIAKVDAVIVMTGAAEVTLRHVNNVGATPVMVIPHGAAVAPTNHRTHGDVQPVVLTWGLIGPGKGIEWMIDAMMGLKDLDPTPIYVIAGRTHPKVLAHQGDQYRESLEQRVLVNDVGDMVVFENSYRDLSSLNELIGSADVVVLPYDSLDQATSGVLVDAVAAGRPVVATAFPHAIELLSDGAGIVVAHKDPVALSGALRQVLTDSDLASSMTSRAQQIAPGLSWDAVAVEYFNLTDRLLPRVAVVA